jgi:hypothetical protein
MIPGIQYFVNESNLGMVKSFNRSLGKAESEYVVMIMMTIRILTCFRDYMIYPLNIPATAYIMEVVISNAMTQSLPGHPGRE